MSTDFQAHISALASTFANSVIAAIRQANVGELHALATRPSTLAPRRGSGRPRKAASAPAPAKVAASVSAKSGGKSKGRLRRRSSADIAKALARVVTLVESETGGLRAEQIRERLGMQTKEMPRVLKEGLEKKVLKSKGVKRSTTYTLA
jgi:hypothetical protein